MRPDKTQPLVKGGQGRSDEEVEFSTIVVAFCLLGGTALVALAWLLHLVGVM